MGEYDIEHRIIVTSEVRWVRERADLEFNEDEMLTGGFGTTQDINEHKRADRMKDEFIGLVSNELPTLLTIAIGSLHAKMSESLSQKDVRKLNKNAVDGAEFLEDILENMFELSRHWTGRLYL